MQSATRRRVWPITGLIGLLVILCAVVLAVRWHGAHSYERLIRAIERGDLDTVRREIRRGVDVNRTFCTTSGPYVDEVAPLMLAATKGDTSVVEALLNAGADPGPLRDGRTALHWALERPGNVPVIRLLIQWGVPLNVETPPLLWAASFSDLESMEVLVRAGCDPNAASPVGVTALHQAALTDDEAKIRFLIEHGANIEAADRSGMTPLMWAATKGAATSVKVLVESGAAVSARDASGRSSIWHAAVDDAAAIVGPLVDAGVDVEAGDVEGRTPLMEGVYWGSVDAVKALLAVGADVNARDAHGRTALMCLSHRSQAAIVELLIGAGADPRAVDDEGRTVLRHAVDEGASPGAVEAIRRALEESVTVDR